MVYDKWTLKEKRKLANLLEVYPLEAYKTIARRIGTKSEEEVKAFVEKMTYSALNYQETKAAERSENAAPAQRAPLEDWIDTCSGLVQNEPFDTSSQLSKVMSIIGHLEEFPTTDKHPPVDYGSIYRYLAQLLVTDRQEDLCQLKPLECAVLLDVIHSLMDVLSGIDLSMQRNVMQWKCKLLDARDQYGEPIPEKVRQAAENDFSDFIELEEQEREKNIENLAKMNTEVQLHGDRISKQSVTHSVYQSQEDKKPVERRSTDPKMVSVTTSSGKVCTYKQAWIHKPGRKRKSQPPETPVTDVVMVLPPENAKIIHKAPRAKAPCKKRTDGKYKGIDNEQDIQGISIGRFQEIRQTPLSEVAEVDTDSDTESVVCQSDQISTVGRERLEKLLKEKELRISVAKQMYEEKRKKYQRLRESMAKASKKKPKLYTINPFNVPVSLLDLDG